MPLRFRILAGRPDSASPETAPTVDRIIDLPDDIEDVRLGRRAGLDIPLPFSALSSLHARIWRKDGGWMLEDLGSANGTTMNGQRLTAGDAVLLTPGQTFFVAHVAIVFDGLAPASPASEGTASIARRLVSDLFAVGEDEGAPALVVAGGQEGGRRLRLFRPQHPYTVGRAPTCDLAVDDESISREHAVFIRRGEGVFVRDLASKNGVRVQSRRLVDEQHVRDGDRVDLGAIAFTLHDPEDRYLRQMQALELAAPSVPASPSPGSGPSAATKPQRGTTAFWTTLRSWAATRPPRAIAALRRTLRAGAPRGRSAVPLTVAALVALLVALGILGLLVTALFGQRGG